MNINERVEIELTRHDHDLVRYQNWQIKGVLSGSTTCRSRRRPGRKREVEKMDLIKKVASRKFGVAVLSAAPLEALWQTVLVATAIYPREAIVDTWGE